MEATEFQRLAEIMRRLAGGDRAAIVTLYVEFGTVLAGVVRRHLGRLGVAGVTRDDLDGLVLDACFTLADCARGWDPATGVAPWTWAERRVAALATKFVGIHTDELTPRAVQVLPAPAPAPGTEGEALDLLALSLAGEPLCRLLQDAFDAASVSTRDQRLLLETRLQATLGDRAPADTVAPLFGMQPAAVRQAVKRAKDRLRRLAHDDAAFAPLAELAILS